MRKVRKILHSIPKSIVQAFCRQSAGLVPGQEGWPLATEPASYVKNYPPSADIESLRKAQKAIADLIKQAGKREKLQAAYHQEVFSNLYEGLLQSLALNICLDDEAPHGFRLQIWLCEAGEYYTPEAKAIEVALDNIDPLIQTIDTCEISDERFENFRKTCLDKAQAFFSAALDAQRVPGGPE